MKVTDQTTLYRESFFVPTKDGTNLYSLATNEKNRSQALYICLGKEEAVIKEIVKRLRNQETENPLLSCV